MKNIYTLLFVYLLLTSCATSMNEDRTKIVIYMQKKPSAIIYQSDTLTTSVLNDYRYVSINAFRSKDSLRVQFIDDSLRRTISLPAKLSSYYYGNIFTWGIGFILDANNNRRYTYPNGLMLDSAFNLQKKSVGNKQELITRELPKFATYKNDIFFQSNYIIPIAPSHSSIQPLNSGRKSYGGFWGMSAGFDYYYKKDRFVNLSAQVVMPNLFSMGYDDFSDKEGGLAINGLLTHNHRIERLSYGYGLSYTYNEWRETKYTGLEKTSSTNNKPDSVYSFLKSYKEASYSTLGFAFNGYYLISPHFTMGIVYKPSFVRLKSLTSSTFCYEHHLTFEMAFRFRVWKGKR